MLHCRASSKCDPSPTAQPGWKGVARTWPLASTARHITPACCALEAHWQSHTSRSRTQTAAQACPALAICTCTRVCVGACAASAIPCCAAQYVLARTRLRRPAASYAGLRMPHPPSCHSVVAGAPRRPTNCHARALAGNTAPLARRAKLEHRMHSADKHWVLILLVHATYTCCLCAGTCPSIDTATPLKAACP